MIKQRYISPATKIVEMYELESAILIDSRVKARVYVDDLDNVNNRLEDESEKFYFDF